MATGEPDGKAVVEGICACVARHEGYRQAGHTWCHIRAGRQEGGTEDRRNDGAVDDERSTIS